MLLEHGARIDGSNAFYHALDFDNLAALELLLQYGADPNEPLANSPHTEWGLPLLWAIKRRRSRQHVVALLKAGADPSASTLSGISAYSLALQLGLGEVAELLRENGGATPVTEVEQFIAACARGDEAEAQGIRTGRPDLPGSLQEAQLRLLPDLAAEGGDEGARLMVKLGWPVAVRGGDWNASALNLAVFRGNVGLTRFFLSMARVGGRNTATATMSAARCHGRRATNLSRMVTGRAARGRCLSMACQERRSIPKIRRGY